MNPNTSTKTDERKMHVCAAIGPDSFIFVLTIDSEDEDSTLTERVMMAVLDEFDGEADVYIPDRIW